MKNFVFCKKEKEKKVTAFFDIVAKAFSDVHDDKLPKSEKVMFLDWTLSMFGFQSELVLSQNGHPAGRYLLVKT